MHDEGDLLKVKVDFWDEYAEQVSGTTGPNWKVFFVES